MSKDQLIRIEGVVLQVLPDSTFKVKINNTDTIITAYTSGRIRKNKIRILVTDKVMMEVSTHDKNKGRIITRL